MPFISITRLRVRSVRFLLPFVRYTLGSQRQAKKASGNLGVQLRKTKGLTFWTMTLWENEAAMKAFRTASPHREAMPKLLDWCDEASYVHGDQNTTELPRWEQAAEQLRERGHLSKVRNPSEDQKAGRIAIT